MARQAGNIASATFSKGFITETGPLGYPENACKDIDNMVLNRNGSVRVRNGLIVPKVNKDLRLTGEDVTSVHEWYNAGTTDDDFVVVQVGDELYIKSVDTEFVGERTFKASSVTGSGQEITSLTVLASSLRLGGVSATQRLSSYVVQGKLFMSNSNLGAFYLWYLPEGRFQYKDTIFKDSSNLSSEPTAQIVFCDLMIRDFEGLEDGLEITERPSELSPEHEYNLKNQGWSDERITKFFNGAS